MFDVTALFSAIDGVAKLGKPVLDEAVAQQHDAALRARLREFANILGRPDSVDRADDLARFVAGLCADSGHPVAPVADGPSIRIPVAYFVALVTVCAECVKLRADLARVQFQSH